MNKLWASHKQIVNKLLTSHTSHEKSVNMLWTNNEQLMNKLW